MGSLAAHHKDCIIGEQWSTSRGARSSSVYLIDETSPKTTNCAETLCGSCDGACVLLKIGTGPDFRGDGGKKSSGVVEMCRLILGI